MIRMRTLRDSKYTFAGFQLLEPSTIRLPIHFTESLHLASFFPFGQSFGIYFGMCFPIQHKSSQFSISKYTGEAISEIKSVGILDKQQGVKGSKRWAGGSYATNHTFASFSSAYSTAPWVIFYLLLFYNKPIYQFGRVVFFFIVVEESDPSTVSLLFVGVLL